MYRYELRAYGVALGLTHPYHILKIYDCYPDSTDVQSEILLCLVSCGFQDMKNTYETKHHWKVLRGETWFDVNFELVGVQ